VSIVLLQQRDTLKINVEFLSNGHRSGVSMPESIQSSHTHLGARFMGSIEGPEEQINELLENLKNKIAQELWVIRVIK
jgi:hypothetical protein